MYYLKTCKYTFLAINYDRWQLLVSVVFVKVLCPSDISKPRLPNAMFVDICFQDSSLIVMHD